MLPAEAGLDERAVSFTKGCYPGQEPIARQHHRGKVNRRLRVLEIEGDVPEPETPVVLGEKEVGRVTSAVPGLALAYVRVEVAGRRRARGRRRSRTATLSRRAPVAQGIEHQLAELRVARSNRAGRIS